MDNQFGIGNTPLHFCHCVFEFLEQHSRLLHLVHWYHSFAYAYHYWIHLLYEVKVYQDDPLSIIPEHNQINLWAVFHSHWGLFRYGNLQLF